ncbi:hypothetical protein EYR36_001847 [Pleurotus pulmonarius]|nr:hypothetical protein EYR36_001847 [Pleurotus pulmonarius]
MLVDSPLYINGSRQALARWIPKANSRRAASATSKAREGCEGCGTQWPGRRFRTVIARPEEQPLHRKQHRTPANAPPAHGFHGWIRPVRALLIAAPPPLCRALDFDHHAYMAFRWRTRLRLGDYAVDEIAYPKEVSSLNLSVQRVFEDTRRDNG